MFKSIVSLALLTLLSTSTVSASPSYLTETMLQSRFVSWMNTHHLDYSSSPELMFHRYNTFKDNLAAVEAHNEEAEAGKHSFVLGLTPFAAMTNQEYRMNVLGLNKKRRGSMSMSMGNGAMGIYEPKLAPAKEVDWRTKGMVTAPKNQGQCGSCWAFSAGGAMEGAHALATGKLVSLSEQSLVDCVMNGAYTCELGGEMHEAYAEVINAGGIESEADYPYKGTSGNKCHHDKSKFVATFSSYMNVTSGDESALAAALTERPGVSIGIDASSFWFQLYMGGVFDLSSCKNKYDELNHGVLAVGYGNDASSGKDFYWVKNSWGGSWGDKGYIKMARNKDNQCGVATYATFPLV